MTPEYVAALEAVLEAARPFADRKAGGEWANYTLHQAVETADKLNRGKK